jgi:hypothetical protein
MSSGAVHVRRDGNTRVATLTNPPLALTDVAILEDLGTLVKRAASAGPRGQAVPRSL